MYVPSSCWYRACAVTKRVLRFLSKDIISNVYLTVLNLEDTKKMNFNKDEKSSSAQNWNLSRTVISSSPRYFFVSWDDVQGHQIGNPLKEKQKRRRSWSKRETERGRKFFSVYHFCACHFGSKRQSISLQHPLRHLSQGKVIDQKKIQT